MHGHTREQLEARGARLDNYKYCENCGLYWSRSLFKKHINVASGARAITIIPPAMEAFLNFLARTTVQTFVKEHPVTGPDGTTVPPKLVLTSEWEELEKHEKTAFTVDEAVQQFGLSRDEIMAALEKNREVFRVEIPAAGSRRRDERRRRARSLTDD
ncbi:MAG: hypothetical protein KF764_00945 [Labilithrix sp.]|nr:hypothetical protein [Labilithrix sp.]